MIEIHGEPDEPLGFGPKCFWIAAPAPDARSLAEALGLEELRASGWKSGFQVIYQYPSGFVFVTPPVAGWVLAAGAGLPDPGDPALLPRWRSLMASVSQRFGEAQFFASHRGSNYSAWARYCDGAERRLFAYADDPIYDIGEPLPEEADLISHLPDPDAAEADPDYWSREDLRTPEEEDVLRLAGAWSVSPETLDSLNLPASTGLVGRMPRAPEHC
jgi:hypothetical protein